MKLENGSVIPHSCPDIGEQEIEALVACARSMHVKGGERVRVLEQGIAQHQGYAGAVATTTGSQAIHLALRAFFAGRQAIVGLPSYLCRSVYDAVCLAGCRPQLLDIDPFTFSVAVEQATRIRLDAVIVPHMFGIRAPIETFLAAGLFVIEDCAQRLALPPADPSEPKAPVRIVSFEATKLITCGEGGMVLSDDPAILHRSRQLRDAPYDFAEPAVQLPLTDLQASMALVQWQRLPEFLAKRRRLADFYLRFLEGEFSKHIVPAMRSIATHHFRFLIWVDEPATFLQQGLAQGVSFRRPIAPLSLHTLFGASGSFPVTDEVFSHLISLPLYPALSLEDAMKVAQSASKGLRAG